MELLAPAGSLDSLKAAVRAGADAVYIGGSRFGARAYADNPEQDLLLSGIDYCHLHGRQLYMTVNTLLKEQELEEQLYEYLLPYYREGLDGVIVQDLGVVRFIQEQFPLLPVHASTQMTITGVDGAMLMKEYGLTRIVPARELTLGELREIIDRTGLEVETFVHGAMCYSYSGQCLLSSMIGGRSGNRGRCAQPCRLPYTLYGAGQKNGTGQQYLMSLKDMCAIDLLPELMETGITSLKIEGRMKKPEYTAGVVSIYRKYLDRVEAGERQICVTGEDRRVLLDLYSRGGFSSGYYHVKNGPKMMTMKRPNHLGSEAARMEKRRPSDRGAFAQSLCALSKGDVLEAVPQVPGQKGPELTLREDIAAGKRFMLPQSFAKLPASQMIYRTRNERLLTVLHEEYVLKESKEKIKGVLIISAGKPVILEVSCGTAHVAVTGDAAQTAQKRPLTREDISRQIGKTGDSAFVFETIDIRMDGEIFLPLQSLNQLRREALTQLENQLCSRYFRCSAEENVEDDVRAEDTLPAGGNFESVPESTGTVEKQQSQADVLQNRSSDAGLPAIGLAVSVQEMSQLDTVLAWTEACQNMSEHTAAVQENSSARCKVDTLYLDAGLLFPVDVDEHDLQNAFRLIHRVQHSGIRCMLQMPPIFRQRERGFYRQESVAAVLQCLDGFLVRCIDAFAFLRAEGYQQSIIADDSLYAYNRRAAVFWKEAGASRLTLPSELNVKELARLDTGVSEMIVYGRTQLMVTAQCLKKNTSGCTGVPDLLYLKDRRQASFPVRTRCAECCNVIYNSVPLDLLDCRMELQRLHPAFFRLSFTTESWREAAEILGRYEMFLSGAEVPSGGENRTRGHFRRGVE